MGVLCGYDNLGASLIGFRVSRSELYSHLETTPQTSISPLPILFSYPYTLLPNPKRHFALGRQSAQPIIIRILLPGPHTARILQSNFEHRKHQRKAHYNFLLCEVTAGTVPRAAPNGSHAPARPSMVKRGMLPAVVRGENSAEEDEGALGSEILKRRGPLLGSCGYVRDRSVQKTSRG